MLKRILIGVILTFFAFSTNAQTTYEMSNMTVTDCRGIFIDSEDGQTAGNYDHNENFVFTICVPGASSIKMVLANINTEKDADTLSFYDGNNTGASSLGNYHGNYSNITITSTGNCLTIKFVSDKSLANIGWNATWESVITSVPMPTISPIPNPTCNSTSIDITMDQRFNCDSIDENNFGLQGPAAPGISSVTGLNCDGNNEASQFRVNFTGGLTRSGVYYLPFQTRFIDACDSVWILQDTLIFRVTDCPIEVTLDLDNNPICRGTCAELSATVIGGDSTMYVYNWTPSTLSGAGPHTVCPNTTTEYKLVVTDGTSVPGRDSITLNVVDPPTAQNDTTVCISAAAFNLTAIPAGGTWSGTGITNAANGTFDPGVAGGGAKWIYYTISGCYDSVRVTVRNIWAGLPQAACPGAAPFQVFGFPAGGTWSGANITPAGIFTPPITPGTYTVTYTWNGCSADKDIEVDNIQITLKPDSMCRSEAPIDLGATPFGGAWSGPGITNSILGTFEPIVAGTGFKNIRYTVQGCVLDTWIFVKDVNARWNEVFCPDEGIVTFPAGLPAGGIWSGRDVVDSAAGTWDVGTRVGHPTWGYNDTAWYTVNGCVDEKLIYIRPTVILNDSLNFCIEEPQFRMVWATARRTPGGGTWSGPGVTPAGWFTAANAGYGLHKLYYTANTCVDSMLINIYQFNIQNDTTMCITEPAITLYKDQPGGTWSGRGVTNPVLGTFTPSNAGVGTHKIFYTSVNGCIDSLEITITPRPTVTLSGLDPLYCFKDTNVILNFTPPGGTFTGTPLNGNDFNPALAGKGPVSITYTYGTPQCQRSRTVTTVVGDTLFADITQDKDSICPGGGVNLSAAGRGGKGFGYGYNWDNGRTTSKDIFELPTVDTRYIVKVEDGCSNPAFDTVYVGIHPQVNAVFQTSPIQCFGAKGWAKVIASPPSPNYTYQWNTNPTNTTDSIYETVGLRYRVNIVNTQTTCFWDGDILIPGYPRVNAIFTTFPRIPACINNLNPTVSLIDFSDGGIQGYWDYGDGTRIPYVPGVNPVHDFPPDTNAYEIKLYIENVGGCADSAFFPVCMIDTVLIYVPNAFSPAKIDGINDVFLPVVNGTTEYNLEIFNRWGQKIFETMDPTQAWDGKIKGVLVPTDYYHFVIRYKGKQTPRKYQTGVIFLIK